VGDTFGARTSEEQRAARFRKRGRPVVSHKQVYIVDCLGGSEGDLNKV